MIEVKENELFAPVLDALRQAALIIFEHPDRAGQQMASVQQQWTNKAAGGLRPENFHGQVGLPGMVINLEPEVIERLRGAGQLIVKGEPAMATDLVIMRPALYEVGDEQLCVLAMMAQPLDPSAEVKTFSAGTENFAMIDPHSVQR